jgi:predicted DNA-binding transcriptional regulator AlpA
MTVLSDADGFRKRALSPEEKREQQTKKQSKQSALPLMRYEDLRASGIVQTWTSLNKWIDERGFPPGRIIGRFRTWTTAEVMAWIESQPSTKAKRRGVAKLNASDQGAQ